MIGPFFGQFTNLLIHILHAHLIDAWSSVQQTVIDDAVDQWRERLHCCVKANS